MNITIRKAKTDDLEFLWALENKSFPEFQRNTKQNIKNSIVSQFQELLIVETGHKKKQSIGSVILFKYKYSLRIYSIAVLPEHQNKGIGEVLLNHVKEYAIRGNFEKIILEVNAKNQKLTNWYKTRAFQVTDTLKDYYGSNEDALKMQLSVQAPPRSKKTHNLIVMNKPYSWNQTDINAQIVSVRDYINNPIYHNSTDYRVFNLCSSYKYQSYGYYVSLLASARGQRVIPSITTIRDLRILNVIQSAAYEVDDIINKKLERIKDTSFSLNIYFGQTPNKGFQTLVKKLYLLFEAPLFKVNFIKPDRWLIKDIKILNINQVAEDDIEKMHEFAANHLSRKRYNVSKLTNFKYDLAILTNPLEENPPSNIQALQKLKKVANQKGVYVEFITKTDIDKINEFDALFIRETTNVNHHTYEISRLAFAEGLVVIDDPWSILKCSNKIYQNELFKKHKILTPATRVFTKNLFDKKLLNNLNYPMVLKQPDSAFSLGVTKVSTKEEALKELNRYFKTSDMVICQDFLYSEYDWRIGILDNKPLYACKYYMSPNHWQIYDWNSDSTDKSGDSETLALEDVPSSVLQTALKAASLIGDGLYGVDLKFVDEKIYVVEVNDNPNIDTDVEDLVLGDKLYERIIDSIISKIEIAKNISKINFNIN